MRETKNIKKSKKKKNKKGFTLIELLAVIIILGILLVIAVPAISRYIEESRKNTYINAIDSIVSAVSTSINALEYPLPGKDEAVIVPFSEVNLEKGTSKEKSPYAMYEEGSAYVVVTFNGSIYEYYVVALDEAGYAIPFVNINDLSINSITTDSKTIDNYIYTLAEIENTRNTGIVDAIKMTMKYSNKIGNIIKVKLYETPYFRGKLIQLKDASKWYVIDNSELNSKTVNLISYSNIDFAPSSNTYLSLSKNKTRSTITYSELQQPHSAGGTVSKLDYIINKMSVDMIASGISLTGATIKLPSYEDFGCVATSGACLTTGNILRAEDTAFWTTDSHSNGTYQYTLAYTGAGRYSKTGEPILVKMVVKNLSKSNIDKIATKGLS